MKKIIYLFLVLPLIFSSCAKEEGCTDSQAINYNSDAEEEDESCTYSIVGVWEWQSATQNGTNLLVGVDNAYSFFWANGDYGQEYYAGGMLARYTTGSYTISGQSSFTMTDIGYTTDGTGGWITDAAPASQTFSITKINSNELDGVDAVNNVNVNMGKSTRSLSEF